MRYKNHIFTIHNMKSGNTFQIEGKTAFIEWLNKYSTNNNFKYFTTYNKFKEWENETI